MNLPEQEWCCQLYRAKAATLLLYGRALGLSHSEAEDVLHDTFAALVKKSPPPREPEHYVLRAYRNRARNYHRGFWRRMLRELESSRWFEPGEEEDPRERAAQRALALLPEEQREAIVLKIWHHRTFEEIGTLTGVSPNTAAGRYRYGLQKLRYVLKGTNHGTEEFFRGSDPQLETATPGLPH